jgi:putative peptidoglycan lipid II flippase
LTAKEGLLKAAGIVAALSVISKFLGFAREASLAAVFGATYATDAYLMGQTIPVAIFSAVSAALGSTFIPVFSQVRQAHGRDAAHKMVSSVINATVLLAVAFITIGEFFVGPLTRIVAPGFHGEVYALTVSMTRIMFPMVLFQALSGLLTGMLQADDNFAIPAMTSLAYNITIIGSILLLGPKFGIRAVGAGTVVAIAAQVVLKLPAIARTGYRWSPILNLNDPGLRRMGALIGPVLLATFAGQVSTLVNRMLVSGLAEGSLAALNYATRVSGFPPLI